MDLKKTGRFLSGLRKQRGLTQKELAEKMGVTDKAVSRWETGRGFPDASFLPALAGALGVSISEIVMGERMILQEQAEPPVMEELDQAVADFSGVSQQEPYRKRQKLGAAFGWISLSTVLLFLVFAIVYEKILRFWSDIPLRYAAYLFLTVLVIPIGVSVCGFLLRAKYQWITRFKTVLLTLFASWALLMAATALLYPEFYQALGDVELLRYDWSDTAVYEVMFQLLPVVWTMALTVSGFCLAIQGKCRNSEKN